MIFNYPKTFITFMKWCNTNIKYVEIYNSMRRPRPFDVSLRDGLQSIPKLQQINYSFKDKIKLLNNILEEQNPSSIEIGSLVSPKILPIFNNSKKLYEYSKKNFSEFENFLLIPTSKKLNELLELECNNICLITSVSEEFQKKNVKMNLEETKQDILSIIYSLFDSNRINNPKVKLYISCIDTCPISGKIPIDFIVNEIKYYNDICKVDTLCLSDTCGTLEFNTFIEIIDKCNKEGISYNKISLHLHVNPMKEENIIKIIHEAFDRGIINFDASILDTGGCSVTMNSDKINANLSYELYYKALVDYIIIKSKKLN